MSNNTQNIWLAKLAAWTHDPAEKALVLLRDPAGHEGGTVRELKHMLFPKGLGSLAEHIKRADWWASAADRPQFPRDQKDGRFAAWTQVNFAERPVLIHPLSGTEYSLEKLAIDPAHIKACSIDHFRSLVESDAAGEPDIRRTALSFWRFGPELDAGDLGSLWKLMPADTRIPDHTIWTHLDLSSAFASSFVADQEANPALLSMSFGPVQDFIAQSRTTSDLWAGSHLLSRIAWEGLKVICERLGPDAVIFPQLRGVPLVDLWLRDEMGVSDERFKRCEWVQRGTDANPLFTAALPNKLVAIVPADQAREIALAVTQAVRSFVLKVAREMLDGLLDDAKIPAAEDLPCYSQLIAQLEGFPEVHWASAPFSPLIKDRAGQAPDISELIKAGEPFFGAQGFLASQTWKRLSKPLDLEGTRFYLPNPGVLYPAVYELLDRVAASAKALRDMPQRPDGGEKGYRCDLTGDAEWLTHDRSLLAIPKGERKDKPTLWNLAIQSRPGLSRKGEHLSATAMLKRLWPTWFVKNELGERFGIDTQRFVISTHTLAISTSLERWLQSGAKLDAAADALLEEARKPGTERAALPRRLIRRLYRGQDFNEDQRTLARALPALLERDSNEDPEADSQSVTLVSKLLGDKPEAYYALILLDGDKMGAWISGTDERVQLQTRTTFHPQIRERMNRHFRRQEHQDYLDAPRAVSPNRHMAISSALNDFALKLAQDVVENRCKGKLLYAGGDDVMALVAVDDLLACLTLLRAAYSGLSVPKALGDSLSIDMDQPTQLRLGRGHAMLDGKLLRLMGERASASVGAVIAHHTAPLNAVLRQLRKTEARAKNKGGRDAFSITLLKRGGGATELTLPWRLTDEPTLEGSPMEVLSLLSSVFSGHETSRKAAYLTQGWLPSLPSIESMPREAIEDLLRKNISFRLKRQGAEKGLADVCGDKLAKLALSSRLTDTSPAETLRDVLAVAEFLARESRSPKERFYD